MLKELIVASALLAPVSALAGNWGGTNFAPDSSGPELTPEMIARQMERAERAGLPPPRVQRPTPPTQPADGVKAGRR